MYVQVVDKIPTVQEVDEEEEEEEITPAAAANDTPYIGEYATLDHEFMEIEPISIPLDTPLVPPTSNDTTTTSTEGGKPVKPVFDPGDYSYAELDHIRARKAAAKAAKMTGTVKPQQPPQTVRPHPLININ